MHRLRVFKALRGSASLCPNLEYRVQGSAERWTAELGIGAFARAAAVRAVAAPASEASNKRSCPCVRIWRESLPPPYKEQIEFLDRLKLVVKAMKGLPPDTNFAQALAAAIAEGARALKALEKEQEPMIAAGIAASKTSAEAYAIALKAWEARMERERTRLEEARRKKL